MVIRFLQGAEGVLRMPAKATRYTVCKVRLYPTEAQAALMAKTFGCCRYLWNQMLSDVQEFYAATDIHYIPTPAKYKKGAPFLAEVDSQALCSVHQSLRKAFLDYFRAPQHFGYPQYKTKGTEKDSFTVFCRPYRTGPSIYLTETGIQMPKLGEVRAKLHRATEPGWVLSYVTVTRTKTGKYFASIGFRMEAEPAAAVTPRPERTLGINFSLRHFYVDSEGNRVDLPDAIRKSQAKLSRLHRALSRMERGSKRYEAQQQKIRLLQEHIANQRRDFAHQESHRIAAHWDAVCMRETDLRDLSGRVKGANVLDTGFGAFRACLQYKLAQQGKPLILLEASAPTAKTCHECGSQNDALTYRDREWVCPKCGAVLSHDGNAAKNIRDWGLRQLQTTSETGAKSAVS